MTSLAPRRRPIFARRNGSNGALFQLAGIVAGIALVAIVSFAAGVNYAEHAETNTESANVFAAVTE